MGSPDDLPAAALSDAHQADRVHDARLPGGARERALPLSVLPIDLFRAADAVRAPGADVAAFGGVRPLQFVSRTSEGEAERDPGPRFVAARRNRDPGSAPRLRAT